jgi:hypothetical protein
MKIEKHSWSAGSKRDGHQNNIHENKKKDDRCSSKPPVKATEWHAMPLPRALNQRKTPTKNKEKLTKRDTTPSTQHPHASLSPIHSQLAASLVKDCASSGTMPPLIPSMCAAHVSCTTAV